VRRQTATGTVEPEAKCEVHAGRIATAQTERRLEEESRQMAITFGDVAVASRGRSEGKTSAA
jgi:hypothetical protein